MGDILTTELTFGRFGYGTATDTITGVKRKLLWIVDSSGAVSDSPFANPVITQTSAAGTNPPTWSAVMPDLQVGDRIQLDFTSNGTAPDGTAEETHDPVTSDEAITGDIAWTTFTGFAGGATVKWRQRYGRTIGGTQIWSNWSNTLSDVVNAVAFVPSTLFLTTENGYALDPTDLTKVWQDSGATVAGAFTSPVGKLVDISGKGNHFQATANDGTRPTLANVNNGLDQYDGVNDRLKFGGAVLYVAGSMTFMFAARVTAVAANFLFAEGKDTGGQLYAPGTRQLGTAGEDNYFHIVDDLSSSWVASAVNTNAFDGTIHIFTIIDSGTLFTVYVDGVSIGTVAYTRAGHTVGVNNTFFGCWGPNNTPESFLTGYLGRRCGIGRVLGGPHNSAGSELNKLYNWIAGGHGLATL